MRTVKVERHNQFAADNNMASFFTSSKSGEGVNNLIMNTSLFLMGAMDDQVFFFKQWYINGIKGNIFVFCGDRI
jgi:hypothetical protein